MGALVGGGLVMVGYVMGWFLRGKMDAPTPPVADHTPMLVEALSGAMSKAAEAVGKAVQTAQYAPPDPFPPPRSPSLEDLFDPDVAAGVVDSSDPTDGSSWLQRDRVDAVTLTNGDAPFGIPGLKPQR